MSKWTGATSGRRRSARRDKYAADPWRDVRIAVRVLVVLLILGAGVGHRRVMFSFTSHLAGDRWADVHGEYFEHPEAFMFLGFGVPSIAWCANVAEEHGDGSFTVEQTWCYGLFETVHHYSVDDGGELLTESRPRESETTAVP